MKSMGRLFLAAAALIALLAALYCLRDRPAFSSSRAASAPSTADRAHSSGGPARRTGQVEAAKSAIGDFASWTETYLATTNETVREALIEQGDALAKARLAEMYELVRSNPKAAIERAIPYEQRKRLPESIVSLLEQPVEGKGDFYVLAAVAAMGESKPARPIRRTAVLGGQNYDAYVYGRRQHQVTRENIPLHGVAVGNALAIHEEPARILSQEEANDLIAAGLAKSEAICSVSGESSTVIGQQTFVRLGDQVLNLCRAAHGKQLNTWLIAAEGQWRTSVRASSGSGTNVPAAAIS
jgi:hypothetical protein